MRRGLLVLAALALGCAALASADAGAPSNGSLDPAEVHNVLTSFLRDISEELKAAESSEGAGRRRLQADDGKKPGLAKHFDKLKHKKDHKDTGLGGLLGIGAARDGPAGADERERGGIQEFFGRILGKDWEKWVPKDWTAQDFDWSRLGDFTFSSNLQSFVDTHDVADLANMRDLSDLDSAFEDLKKGFCTKEKFTPSKKIPTTCTGPQVTLAYLPKVCVLDDKTHQVICDPAKLVLVKVPGSCVHKYHTASTWKGKECKITGNIGFQQVKVIGGDEFTIDLDHAPDFKLNEFGGLPWKEEEVRDPEGEFRFPDTLGKADKLLQAQGTA